MLDKSPWAFWGMLCITIELQCAVETVPLQSYAQRTFAMKSAWDDCSTWFTLNSFVHRTIQLNASTTANIDVLLSLNWNKTFEFYHRKICSSYKVAARNFNIYSGNGQHNGNGVIKFVKQNICCSFFFLLFRVREFVCERWDNANANGIIWNILYVKNVEFSFEKVFGWIQRFRIIV